MRPSKYMQIVYTLTPGCVVGVFGVVVAGLPGEFEIAHAWINQFLNAPISPVIGAIATAAYFSMLCALVNCAGKKSTNRP
jgi:hypothetical protein